MNEVVLTAGPTLGILVAVITRWVVTSPKFPWVKPEQAPRIQATAAFLSAVAAVLTAWQTHKIGESEIFTLLTTAQLMIETLGISALFHHWFLRPNNPNKGLDKTIDSKIDKKMDDKMEEKMDQQIEDKMDEKIEDKVQEKMDENIGDKVDQKIEERLDEKKSDLE